MIGPSRCPRDTLLTGGSKEGPRGSTRRSSACWGEETVRKGRPVRYSRKHEIVRSTEYGGLQFSFLWFLQEPQENENCRTCEPGRSARLVAPPSVTGDEGRGRGKRKEELMWGKQTNRANRITTRTSNLALFCSVPWPSPSLQIEEGRWPLSPRSHCTLCTPYTSTEYKVQSTPYHQKDSPPSAHGDCIRFPKVERGIVESPVEDPGSRPGVQCECTAVGW